jgi:hypothetical protein
MLLASWPRYQPSGQLADIPPTEEKDKYHNEAYFIIDW